MVDVWTNFVKFDNPNEKDKEIWKSTLKKISSLLSLSLVLQGLLSQQGACYPFSVN